MKRRLSVKVIWAAWCGMGIAVAAAWAAEPVAPHEEPLDVSIDIAPFARVASWDPKAVGGTKAKRVEEFPAEDVAPYKEVLPSNDGTYRVPETNGQGCIGLEWIENRLLRSVALRFADEAAVPSPESVELQYWAPITVQYWSGGSWTGISAWQGRWRKIEAAPKQVENTLVWSLAGKDKTLDTLKVRWVFAGGGPHPNPLPRGEGTGPTMLKGMSAYTGSKFEMLDVRVESTRPGAAGKAEIEIYNGDFLDLPETSTHTRAWDTSKPLSLRVRAFVPQPYKADRTVLRFRMSGTAFGVAIEDLLANDCVYVPHAGLFVTRLPTPVSASEYLKRIEGKSSVLDEVRRQPDQDFARAWSVVHNPVQDLGPMMISLANDTRKFIVEREGAVVFDAFDRPDDPRGARPGTIYEMGDRPPAVPWRFGPTFGEGKNLKFARHLQGGWLPIPVTTATNGSIEYQQTTYVAPASGPTDDAPWWLRDRAACVAEYRATNGGNAASPARIALGLGHVKNEPFTVEKVPEGFLAVRDGRILALIDTRKAAPMTAKADSTGIVLSGNLPAGQSADCRVLLPAWKVDPKSYAILLGGDLSPSSIAAYWTTLFEPAMHIEIPDRRLSDIILASQVHCMLAARNENRGERISAWAGAAQYGPLESESNAVIRGMDMTGHADFARRGVDFLLSFANPQGFITTGYTIVGTGEVLWTLAEHFERTRDVAWMRKVAPEVAQVCQWITRQREKTERLDARGQKVPEHGLMPPGVSADWDRYAYRLFNDAQFYAGLEMSARALADIGDPAAPAVHEEARRYRNDIVRAYRWAQARTPVVKLANGTWAPADPASMNCLGRVEDFLPAEDAQRSWGYSIELGAHHLTAVGAIDPASRETDWMVDCLEDVQFLRNGWGDYPAEKTRQDAFCLGGFAKIQPYYCRISEIHAARDDVKPFIRSYFNAIPTLVSGENLSFWEHFANGGVWNKPHETGWFLCQTRIMFVQERGDELWLAPFVTNHWMKDGMKVVVRNAPTRFGEVGYTITSHVGKGEIEATVELPENCTATKIVLRLRHPEDKPIRSVSVGGKPHADFNPDTATITLPPGGGTVTVGAEY